MDKPVNQAYTPVLSLYEAKKENLIPILLAFQRKFSYLSRDMMQSVSVYVGVPESSVYNIATFYSQFRLEPPGIHKVHVCRGTACHVMGAEDCLGILKNGWASKPARPPLIMKSAWIL